MQYEVRRFTGSKSFTLVCHIMQIYTHSGPRVGVLPNIQDFHKYQYFPTNNLHINPFQEPA